MTTGLSRILSAVLASIVLAFASGAQAAPVRQSAPAAKQHHIGKQQLPAHAGAKQQQIAKQARINCVQFVKSVADVDLSGNAWQWWHRAEGSYVRGRTPIKGSVMVFQRSGRMVHGHIAVVSAVVDDRTIRVDHANWAPRGPRKGLIDMSVMVLDISKEGDWSMVRVWYDPADNFGRPYPVYGFVYPNGQSSPDLPTVETAKGTSVRPDARPDGFDPAPVEEAADTSSTMGVAQRFEIRRDISIID